jgi:hypothetical protein
VATASVFVLCTVLCTSKTSTVVLVKQVNREPSVVKAKEGRFDVAALLAFWRPAILRQYLYFCTSKARKSRAGPLFCRSILGLSTELFCASICTFVLVKQVN